MRLPVMQHLTPVRGGDAQRPRYRRTPTDRGHGSRSTLEIRLYPRPDGRKTGTPTQCTFWTYPDALAHRTGTIVPGHTDDEAVASDTVHFAWRRALALDEGRDGRTYDRLAAALQQVPALVGKPEAILMVSAHWEERNFTLLSHPRPPMIYDFSGFPEYTYRIRYDAPGAPRLAEQVRELLEGAGIPAKLDPERGFDHGMPRRWR